MSVFQNDYTCPKCGRKDIDLESGIWHFFEAETDIYKCQSCRHLFSDTHDYNHGRNSSSSCPKCGGYAELWDYRCPDCNTKMESFGSRFILLKCNSCGSNFVIHEDNYHSKLEHKCPKCGSTDTEKQNITL